MTLRDLKVGQSARVEAVGGAGALRQHFLDMGVIPGAEVTLVKLAPMGDPMELRIHGYELTLRLYGHDPRRAYVPISDDAAVEHFYCHCRRDDEKRYLAWFQALERRLKQV